MTQNPSAIIAGGFLFVECTSINILRIVIVIFKDMLNKGKYNMIYLRILVIVLLVLLILIFYKYFYL